MITEANQAETTTRVCWVRWRSSQSARSLSRTVLDCDSAKWGIPSRQGLDTQRKDGRGSKRQGDGYNSVYSQDRRVVGKVGWYPTRECCLKPAIRARRSFAATRSFGTRSRLSGHDRNNPEAPMTPPFCIFTLPFLVIHTPQSDEQLSRRYRRFTRQYPDAVTNRVLRSLEEISLLKDKHVPIQVLWKL